MAPFSKLPSSAWRVQVRRKGRYISETFLRREDARLWALDAERQVDRNEAPVPSRTARLKTFGDLVDLHISDMAEVGKAPMRSKAATLDMLNGNWARATWLPSTVNASSALAIATAMRQEEICKARYITHMLDI